MIYSQLVKQLQFSVSEAEIINPSRADPAQFICKSTNEKFPAKVVTRAGITSLCVTFGFVLNSYILEGRQQGDKTFKGMISIFQSL